MTLEKIIRMAREAGVVADEDNGYLELWNFAKLVAAHEREALAEHGLQDVRCECCGYMTHHREHMGCIRAAYAATVSVEAEWIETNKALAKEIIEQRNQYLDMLTEAIELSVKAEREACAKVCEEGAGAPVHSDYTKGLVHGVRLCAAAIRARSTT